MTVSSIQLFTIIKDKIGEREAQAMVEFIEAKVEDTIHEKSDNLATKTDIAEVKAIIADVKAEMIRWMFIFWTGSVVTLAGIMIAVLRYFPGK